MKPGRMLIDVRRGKTTVDRARSKIHVGWKRHIVDIQPTSRQRRIHVAINGRFSQLPSHQPTIKTTNSRLVKLREATMLAGMVKSGCVESLAYSTWSGGLY